MHANALCLGPNWRRSLPTAIAVLYLPFSWLLLIHYPWDSYRLFWLKLWIILPGFLGGIPFHPNGPVEFTAMGISTLLLIGLLTCIGSLGRGWLLVAGVLGLAFGGFSSLTAYRLFRM